MMFIEMLDREAKDDFFSRKESSVNMREDELQRLREYLYSEQCDRDLQKLHQGGYYLDPPKMFYIRKSGSNRRRKVFCFSENDKFLLQYLTSYAHRKTDRRFPPTLYSCRRRDNTDRLYRCIRRYDPHREKYVVKADISSYGESVDVSILDGQLETWFSDEPEVRNFIHWLVSRNCYYEGGELTEGFTSVMSGNPLTAYLENIYLLEVDAYMAERAEVSCRYTDDICAFCEDMQSAEEMLSGIRSIIEGKLNLTLNEEKTGIVMPGEPLDLLGLKYGPDYVDVADNTFNKVRSKVSHRAARIDRQVKKGWYTREEGLQKMAAYIDRYFYGGTSEKTFGWAEQYFPYITRTERLHLLDELSQESMRFAGSGRRTNAKYRVRYEDMRRLGYRPLIHSFFHRFEPGGVLYDPVEETVGSE